VLLKRQILALTGLPRILEDMIRQTFNHSNNVQVKVFDESELTSLHDSIYAGRAFDSIITVLQESETGRDWVKKSLTANPYASVICLNTNVGSAKVFNLKIEMKEVDGVSVENLPDLLKKNYCWFD